MTISNPGATNERGITVLLGCEGSPCLLARQVEAIRAQTVAPRAIWVWVNEPDAQMARAVEAVRVDRVVCSSDNALFHARFALAQTATTEFVALFDDDTIPGPGWFANCLETTRTTPGILGSAGVRLTSEHYRGRQVFGWHYPTTIATEVDLVGHAWFLRTEWLHYLFAERPILGTNGEDIELSARAWRFGQIRTYCPPHPPHDRNVWGSTAGAELGSDGQAASRRPAHLADRDTVVQAEIARGWQPLFLRQPSAVPGGAATGDEMATTGGHTAEPERQRPIRLI